jgi:hypothetical protein
MTSKSRLFLHIVLTAIPLLAAIPSCADTLVTVSIDTSQLVGHPAGPFYAAFQLTDGSGQGNGNTTATISNFLFGPGGAPSAAPALTGGVSGDMGSSVTLTDSAFLNFFSQRFTPGNRLTFMISIAGPPDPAITPDHFAFSILDKTLAPIPTTGGLFVDVLIAVDLNSATPALQTFASDPSRLPAAGGGAINTGAPQIQTDLMPPFTVANVALPANANGWNNSNVTIALTATDNPGGSGVQQITFNATGAQPIAPTNVLGSSASALISTEGITSFNFFATDLAANVEAAQTLVIKLDKTPPSITGVRTPTANANGWNNTDVNISFACADALSGLAPGSPPVAILLSSEGTNQQVSGTCNDLAGNTASAVVSGINIDKTPPVLSGLPAISCTLWPPNHEFITVATISAADVLSGLASFNVNGTSNEPQNPNDPDIIITGTGLGLRTVQLRADRMGTGSGRIYTLSSTAIDAAGNVVNAISTCVVPHDQSQ